MKAKYVGDQTIPGGEQIPDEVTNLGITFPKGKWVEIPDDKAAKFAGNSHFETSEGKAKAEKPEGEEPTGYDAQTVPELRALAAERGVELGDATRKADIVAALQLADEQ